MTKPTIEQEIKIISSRLGTEGKYLDSFPKDTKYFIIRNKDNFIFIEDGSRVIVRPINVT